MLRLFLFIFYVELRLFKISSRAKNIKDISALRGHLRTFKLPYLESLQRDLTQFLK